MERNSLIPLEPIVFPFCVGHRLRFAVRPLCFQETQVRVLGAGLLADSSEQRMALPEGSIFVFLPCLPRPIVASQGRSTWRSDHALHLCAGSALAPARRLDQGERATGLSAPGTVGARRVRQSPAPRAARRRRCSPRTTYALHSTGPEVL